jgi:DNA-binding transcriptional ArsR family regulator
MSVPLYEAKAELFRLLGHPVRIRVRELLQDKPMPVRELLAGGDVAELASPASTRPGTSSTRPRRPSRPPASDSTPVESSRS